MESVKKISYYIFVFPILMIIVAVPVALLLYAYYAVFIGSWIYKIG